MDKRTRYKMYIQEDRGKILICPHCGEAFLHQYKTEIFDRKEDDVEGLHVTTDTEQGIIIKKDLEGNPSKRRDGSKVHFFCENCNQSSALEIYQHKGQTFRNLYPKR